MHMSDALLSPAVGGAMWTATAVVGGRCVAVLRRTPDERRVPLMGVMGAFVFAAQMVNFSIPGTGSSGHLGGGMLLAILLGPHAAFLVMASVLTIQALFFADGGLLALGCNVFNLAFFSSFIVYPLVYLPIAGAGEPTRNRVVLGAVVGSVAALALGASGVVLETAASGISSLPVGPFVLLMLPIHLAIGVVEGLITGTVVLVLWQARPELVGATRPARSLRPVLLGLGVAALVLGCVVSWFASAHPDGLEWSVATASGGVESPPSQVHAWFAGLQERTVLLPDYDFARPGSAEVTAKESPAWPAVNGGTSVSGLLGSALVLGVAAVLGTLVRRKRGRGA